MGIMLDEYPAIIPFFHEGFHNLLIFYGNISASQLAEIASLIPMFRFRVRADPLFYMNGNQTVKVVLCDIERVPPSATAK